MGVLLEWWGGGRSSTGCPPGRGLFAYAASPRQIPTSSVGLDRQDGDPGAYPPGQVGLRDRFTPEASEPVLREVARHLDDAFP
jgi:hypothetical protein